MMKTLLGPQRLRAALFLLICVQVPGGAQASDAEARSILKSMSDYMGNQARFETEIDTSVEVITTAGQKISFNSSGTLQVMRPDKARLRRTGGFSNLEMIFDGTSLVMRDLENNAYARLPISGTIDQMVNQLSENLGPAMPGIDLMLADSYSVLIADVKEAMVVGEAVISGRRCDHLAFRNEEVDWQLWVRTGPQKIPCKIVITTKVFPEAPQFTTTIRSFNSGAAISAAGFAFTPGAGEQAIDIGQLQVDEVPAPMASKEARK